MTRLSRATSAHHLYRCFAADGRLLYIGTTVNLFGRLRAHEANTWWAPQVAKVKAVLFANGIEARAAERRAIRQENPRWNVQGRWATVRNSRNLDDLLDYRRAFVALGNDFTTWGQNHLATVDALVAELEAERSVA